MSSPAIAGSESNASSRINVTDNSELGLPRAVVRMACSKGTYVRAFARDLGEALGSGAHLDSLQRSRSGIFRVENALTVDQAISLLSAPKSL
jgi:tRNA pseudouridine55 synthase